MSLKSSKKQQEKLPPDLFANQVIHWQRRHGRHQLPWQRHNEPYHVLVSELMLQQTQVATVIPYFENWIKLFPDFNTLANSHEDQVLSAWQGLGYYSRARNLYRAAQYVVDKYQGELPSTPEQLREVPGVGPYTAGAITAFAFDKPAAIVDGNVKRLFCRYFGIEGDPSTTQVNREIWALAEQYTPHHDNRVYAQGLLDLGATCCTARNPSCATCPLQDSCYALANERVTDLPMRKRKAPIPTKQGYFLLDFDTHGIMLQQRSGKGVWPRLWCLPELSEAPSEQPIHGQFRHVFSHYRLMATVFSGPIDPATMPIIAGDYQRIPYAELDNFGVPTPIRKYLDSLQW